MKMHYSISELYKISLEILPSTERGIQIRVQKESWPFIEVAGKGGKNGKRREYAPPPDVMKQIQARKLEEALGGLADLPSPTEMEGKPAVRNEETALALPETVCIVDGSTEQQRLCESSRRGVLAAVERVMAEAGVSKEAAITTVLTQAKMPGFEHIAKLFSLAADGRGGGGKLPSVRTIKRWFAARECNSLAPKMSQKDMNVPSWLPLFLECYRLPMKPSVAEAYRFFLRRLESEGNECPSIHTVRRWLDKVGNVERERGRRGARDLKNILPHKRREFMHLKPAAIYTADGHTFDAEVLNPLSDRLPLAFRRPLGGKPEDGGHAPSVPGRIPVAKSWGFAAYKAADAAVCAAQAQAAAGVSLDWAHLPKGSAGTAACITAATADTAALYLARTLNHTPSVRRAGCTRAASKDAPPLRHCDRSTTAAAPRATAARLPPKPPQTV